MTAEQDATGRTSDRGPADDAPAGRFDAWFVSMQAALRRERDADVPCGSCTACCRSSQFIHIEPDEREAIAAIPAPLLVAAPMRPPGHLVMGFDADGCCPMLVDDRCSIYDRRPRTCRTYDCRVFPAAGLEPDQPLVAVRTRRWRFDDEVETRSAPHPTVRRRAVSEASAFLARHEEVFGDRGRPPTTVLAVLAVKLAPLFFDDPANPTATVEPTVDQVRAALART